ncbi:MAG: preprotein translocase subunit YajC [Elusimicrobia bacterium]|nr:preprotein translocase subunit YajC [Elusimicrobiota bacterium]
MQPNPNPIMSLVPIAAIFVIFYFFLIRPQQKQQQEHKKMLENLQKGDKILTSGGVYGVIVGFKGTDLEVKIADNVKVLVARSAVSNRVTGGTEASTPAASGVGA